MTYAQEVREEYARLCAALAGGEGWDTRGLWLQAHAIVQDRRAAERED